MAPPPEADEADDGFRPVVSRRHRHLLQTHHNHQAQGQQLQDASASRPNDAAPGVAPVPPTTPTTPTTTSAAVSAHASQAHRRTANLDPASSSTPPPGTEEIDDQSSSSASSSHLIDIPHLPQQTQLQDTLGRAGVRRRSSGARSAASKDVDLEMGLGSPESAQQQTNDLFTVSFQPSITILPPSFNDPMLRASLIDNMEAPGNSAEKKGRPIVVPPSPVPAMIAPSVQRAVAPGTKSNGKPTSTSSSAHVAPQASTLSAKFKSVLPIGNGSVSGKKESLQSVVNPDPLPLQPPKVISSRREPVSPITPASSYSTTSEVLERKEAPLPKAGPSPSSPSASAAATVRGGTRSQRSAAANVAAVGETDASSSSATAQQKDLPPTESTNSTPYIPLSICSLNSFLPQSIVNSAATTSSLALGSTSQSSKAGLVASTLSRPDRIAEFLRGVHVCLLQEAFGPGVDTLTAALKHTHSIPAALKSNKMPLIAAAVNTVAYLLASSGFLTATGLWVAYSRVEGWDDEANSDETSPRTSPIGSPSGQSRLKLVRRSLQQVPRYPPTRRPDPHLSLKPVPLTVPSARTFSSSSAGRAGGKKGIRALLLDASEFWGPRRRLLCFNVHLDERDPSKRRLQLKECASYIREVVFSLASITPDNACNPAPTSTSGTSAPSSTSGTSRPLSGVVADSGAGPASATATTTSEADSISEEFDMIDEYSSSQNAGQPLTPLSPPSSPRPPAVQQPNRRRSSTSSTPNRISRRSQAHNTASATSPHNVNSTASSPSSSVSPTANLNAALALPPLTPPHALPHLRTICAETAVVIGGSMNIDPKQDRGEHSLMIDMMGGDGSQLLDYFASNAEATFEPARNSLARRETATGATARRTDYLLGMRDCDVGGGEVVKFLQIKKVRGHVGDQMMQVSSEEMSDHWPVVGWFVPTDD